MICNCDILCECPPFEDDWNLWDGEFGTFAVHSEVFKQVMTNTARGIGKTVRTFVSNVYEHYTGVLWPLAEAVMEMAETLTPPPKSPKGPPEDLRKRPQVCASGVPRLLAGCAPVAQFPHLVVRTARHVPP